MNRFNQFLRVMMCAVLLLATAFQPAAADTVAPATVSGKVTKVTLYRGQAMVTREVPLEGAPGAREIVVGNLPEHVVSDSLFAEGSAGVEVRAVRYRTHAVGEATREEVRQLDEQIEAVNQKTAVNGKTKELLAKKLAYLDQLEGFVAPTAKTELSKGVLDAEALKQITLFGFEQRQEILEKQVENEKEAKDLGEELSLLQRKRSELTNGASQTAREAVVFAEKKGEAPDVIRLAYLVNSCGWSPSYTIRAGEDRKEVRIELGELKETLSDDKLYQRVERPKGILRWDVEVPAGAIGEGARLIEYNYTAEFDRQFQLTAAAADTPSQQREFEQLQRVRNKR